VRWWQPGADALKSPPISGWKEDWIGAREDETWRAVSRHPEGLRLSDPRKSLMVRTVFFPTARLGMISGNGSLLLGSDQRGVAQAWDTRKGETVGAPVWHESPVVWMRDGDDSRRVLTLTEKGFARVWLLPEDGGAARRVVPPHRVKRVWWLPSGELALKLSTGPILRWGEGAPQPDDGLTEGPANRDDPTGTLSTKIESEGAVRVREAAAGELIAPPLRHKGVIGVAWNADGTRLATYGGSDGVRVWDFSPASAPLETLALASRWLTVRQIDGAGRLSAAAVAPEQAAEARAALRAVTRR
jgi:WD40 repeat protein